MENLPRDIVLDIFSRLPVTSFRHIKCVCRAWRFMVQDPILPSMYHARLDERNPNIILQPEETPYQANWQLTIVGIGRKDGCSSYSTKMTPGRIDSTTILRRFYVAGSCNGLLCVSDKLCHDSLYVFNPFATGRIELPKPVAQSPDETVALGFGVNTKTGQYKIVRIAYFQKFPKNHQFPYEWSDVQIFTIGTQAWRHIGIVTWRLDCRPSEATVNGALHWVTRRHSFEPLHLHIISFDLVDEQFKEIQRPDKCDYLDIHNYQLVALRGCLSIAAVCGNQIEIWMMKEYNVRESWTKEFTIAASVPFSLGESLGPSLRRSWEKPNLLGGSIQVLCVLKSGKILLEYESRGLVMYDPAGEDFKELITSGIPKKFSTVIHYPSPFPVEAILQMYVFKSLTDI